MDNRTIKRIRLLSAVPVLGLACGVLAMSAAPAGAATAPARATSTSARSATAPPAVSGPAHLALNGAANASVRPQTCTPNDTPIRFSGSTTWNTGWLEKTADGCQSVWATSGQTFNYELVNTNYQVFGYGTCDAGFCQIWDPAVNYYTFYVIDTSYTTTSVNFYY
jgi:hypothetical protein